MTDALTPPPPPPPSALQVSAPIPALLQWRSMMQGTCHRFQLLALRFSCSNYFGLGMADVYKVREHE